VGIDLGGSATPNFDYIISNSTAIIPPGQTSTTFVIQVLDDYAFELTETVIMSLRHSSDYSLGQVYNHTLTLTDNDSPPTVSFSSEASSTEEGSIATHISVDLSNAAGLDLEIPFVMGGTARVHEDYELPVTPLTITAGATTAQIEIPIIDDGYYEGAEFINLTLTPPFIADLGTITSHQLTITDNEELPELSITIFQQTINEADHFIPIQITQSVLTETDVVVPWTVHGTALENSDFVLAPNPAVIPARFDSTTLNLVLINDEIPEPSETIVITLDGPIGDSIILPPPTTLTVEDDGDASPVVGFSTPTQSTSEGAGTISVVVELSAPSGLPIVIPYSLSGTSESGVDFFVWSEPLTISPGDLSTHIPVTLVDDLIHESVEEVNFELGDPTNALLSETAEHLLIIEDNDAPPTVNFQSLETNVYEIQEPTTVKVTIDTPSAHDISIPYTLNGTAISGLDFTLSESLFFIPAGSNEGEIPLQLLNDDVFEETESIHMTLGSAIGVQLGAQITHTISIEDDESPPVISFSLESSEIVEGDTSFEVSIELSGFSSSPVQASLSIGGTADPTLDYTQPSLQLEIPPHSTLAKLTVNIHEDQIDEHDETIVLVLDSAVDALPSGRISHTVHILDNDDPVVVGFSTDANLVLESSGQQTLVIHLSAVSGIDVTLDLQTSGIASQGADYLIPTELITISAGSLERSISIDILNDDIDEVNESLVISLSGVVGAVEGLASEAEITILDDDPTPSLQFETATSQFSEPYGTALLTVQLSEVSGQDIFFDLLLSGTATSGVDYTLNLHPVLIEAGQTYGFVFIDIVDDLEIEGLESLNLTLVTPAGAVLGSQSQHMITIIDDDIAPAVTFSSSNQAVQESDHTTEIEIVLSEPTALDVTIPFTVTGTAQFSADYQISTLPLVIPSGYTTGIIYVTLLEDYLVESDEVISVVLGPPTNGVLGEPSIHHVTILDNEPPPIAQFTTNSTLVSESENTTTFVVELSHSSTADVVLELLLTGTAVAGSDYTVGSQTIIIPAGSLYTEVEFVILEDGLYEITETTAVELTSPLNAILGPNAIALLEIVDNDPIPVVNFSQSSSSGSEHTNLINIDVSLSSPAGHDVILHYTVSAEAEPGIDFSITSSPIVFPSGTTQGSITLIPSPDDLDEPDEAIVISLSQPSGAVLGPINQHTATIIDANPPPVIEFNSVTSTTLEGDAETAVFVSLSGPISTAISVPYTITGSATENEDFLVSSSTIQFPPRVTHMALNVDLISDTLFESAETITFVMLPTSVVTLGTRSEHTLTILDDDPQPEVSFQITAQSVVEDAGVARVALQLSSVSGVDTIVPLGISGGGTVSEDYFPSVASITILAGYATGELLIDILDDYIQETDETLTVALGVPVGAQLGTITTHLLTITDNDPPPTISFLQSDFHLGEGEGSTFIEVALSAPSIETVHTTVSVVGSAMVDIDYLITPQVLFFVPGQTTQTISVTALDDLAHEATETVTLSLDPMDNAGLGENPFTTVHVIDNDVVPTVSFATTSTSSNENGGMISLVLALNTVSNLPVTVPFSIGGTATNFVDYVIDASPAVIPAGSLTTSIMVLPIPDPVAEPNETIRVTLIGATNGSLGLKRVHEVTLHNESELPAVFFSEASQTISESSGSASFSLRLAAVSALTVDVTLSFSGTAQSPDDYAQPPALVSFPPGIQEILFSIPITDDSIDEDDEVIELNLLGASGATVGTPQQHVITLLDDDSPPTVFFPMTSVQQVEDFVTIHLPIRLTKISSLPVTAHYTFGGNAIEGEDFTITPSPVTISPGELESTIAVTIFSDVIADENEVLIVALQSAENAVLGTDHLVTLEILDDQSTPLISFTTSAQSVSESDDAITVEVSLSRIFESDQIISISITGSAETGSDYTISSNSLTIPTGSVTGSMILTPLIDQVHEGAETVILTLSAPPGTALGDHATHTITILDDDSAPLVNLEPLPSSVVEGEPSLTLEATLSNLSSLPVLVVLSFSGTAHLGIDYTASNSVLFIAPNSTTGFIELSIADDLIIEGSETVEIQIVNAAGGIVGATDTTSFVILDSDHLPTVSFDSSSSTVEEGVSNHLISLTLSSESPNLVTVPISFQGTAVSSLDFIATPIPVVFSPGQTSTSITINVLDDDLHESVEIVTLSLGSLTGALTGEITQHTITVSDADPPPIVNVVTQETSIDESGGVTSILVTLSAISGLEVTIPYTFGGSASSADHGAEPGSLVIPAGTINGTIEVPVFDDLLHEDDELLILFLGMATNATTGLPNQFDLTIIDNDDAPGVRFTTASQSVTESEQNLTVSLELSSISGLETIVDLSLSGTASSPEDYSLPASQVSIPAGSVGSTVSVSIVEDNIFEGSEELVITIASVVGGTPIPPSTHVVTIEDSMSQPLVNFIGTSSEISEGLESIQVTVELSAPTDLEITVPYQVLASSTALVGTDFVIAPSPLVFTPGEVGGLISISIIDDAAAEISETIDLQILSPNNASLGNLTQHTVTILDDDDLPCDLAYSQADVVYPPGVLISPNLPSVSCGIPTSWSVTPQLPNGLSLDETSGEIFGTPVDRSARTDHAITASNTHGSTTTTISIAIDFIFYYTGTSETALYNPATGELVAPLSIIPVSLFYREDPHNFPVPNTFHETKGLSTSIQHDPLQLTAVQVEIGADLTTLNGGMGPDFFGPLLGSNVVTIGVVYSIELLEQVTVTADVEREIASIHYAPLPGLLIGNMAGLTLTLPWGHPLGALGIQNEIVIDGATGVTPLTTDPTIELIAQ